MPAIARMARSYRYQPTPASALLPARQIIRRVEPRQLR